MQNQAKIVLSAVDQTGNAFRSLNGNLSKTATLSDQVSMGMKAIAATTIASVTAAYVAFDQLVKKAGEFQDMAEKTGDSAQNIASLAVAAQVAGTGMDVIVSAANKLTKNLTGVDDESKAAGAALAALGINIAAFKQLGAADQFETVAKAMDGFQDGAQKSAVAMALWGKSGAELIPFMKELSGETGRQVILTNEQIKQADEYADRQAKLRAEIGLYAQAIATQALPAMNEMASVLRDLFRDQEFAATATELMKGALNGIVVIFQAVAVAGSDLGFVLKGMGREIGAVAAQLATLGSLDFKGFNAISEAVKEDGQRARAELDRFQARVLALGQPAYKDPRLLGAVGSIAEQAKAIGGGKPKLNFNGATAGGSAAKGQDLAKAQRDLDIENIKKAGEAAASAYSNAEKIMEALRSAGLIDESDYYQKKLAFLNLNAAAQESALQDQITRLKAESLSGKEKLDNDKKIVDAEAALAKLRADSVTSVEVLKIQETAALKAVAASWRDAEAAAQDYLDTLNRTQQRELAGFGAGRQERDRTAGRAQIEDRYSSQRQQLELQRRQAELNGTFGSDAQAKYDDELSRITRFQGEALKSYDAYYTQRTALEADASKGMSEAVANYASEAANVAAQTESLFTNAFKGMEDALVGFVMTGKLNFKSLADSIVADITRIILKQQIANLAGNLFGGASGTSGNNPSAFTASAGSGIGSFLSSLLGKASGGPVSAGGMYRVNENGPELLNIAGKQYLMMGSQPGSVTPNGAGGGNSVTVNVNQSFASGTSRATTLQAAADARRQLEYAGRNL